MSEPETAQAGDRVVVRVHVAAPPALCFRLFTEDIDRWWRRGRRFRASGPRRGVMHIEPFEGGRLFETFEGATGRQQVVATGEVTRWAPPELLELTWRNVNFRADEQTFVRVRFEPAGEGTRVVLTHWGWAELRPDHPTRHGQGDAAFLRTMGMWWGELLRSLRELAAAPPQ